MILETVWRMSFRLATSLLCAGAFYAVWLGTFLLVRPSGTVGLAAFFWLTAPVVTAAGYALGLTLVGSQVMQHRNTFLSNYTWPLLGCAVGAASVFPFGPMLIVFGMFLVGSLAVMAREVWLVICSQNDEGIG